jgi:hypothetical protein
MPRVKILYEDQAAGMVNEYGPHKLVCWLTWDRTHATGGTIEFHELRRRLIGYPRKGVDKVRAACQYELADLANDGSLVIALVDNDRIRRHLKLPQDACRSVTTAELRKGCEPADRLRVVLLYDKMESVVDAVIAEMGLAKLGAKPSPIQRDAILGRACGIGQENVRRAVAARVASLAYLVDKIEAELKLAPTSSW